MAKGKSTDIRILDVEISFESVSFRAPLKFGGRIIDHTYLINAVAQVETRNGLQARGFGSMPVGNVWAWPSDTVSQADTESAMKAYAMKFGELFGSYPEYAHPTEIQFNVGAEFHHQARKVSEKLGLAEPLPNLLSWSPPVRLMPRFTTPTVGSTRPTATTFCLPNTATKT
ncbi:MAG: hypothetical protein R3C49_14110 [Planctomycetaceae bacterium]